MLALWSMLRKNARLALKGSLGRAMLVLLLLGGIRLILALLLSFAMGLLPEPLLSAVPGLETEEWSAFLFAWAARLVCLGIFSILSWLLLSPLQLGLWGWFRELTLGRSLPVGTVFACYGTGRRFRRSIRYSLSLLLRALGWAVLFFLLPGGILLVSAWFLPRSEDRSQLVLATLGFASSHILMLLAAVLFVVWMNRYLLVPWLLCEDEELSVSAAVKDSIRHTAGYRFGFLMFTLTYTGWFLLSIPTLGLSLLYTVPLFCAGQAMFSRYIVEEARFVPPDTTREFIMEQSPEPAGPPEAQPEA